MKLQDLISEKVIVNHNKKLCSVRVSLNSGIVVGHYRYGDNPEVRLGTNKVIEGFIRHLDKKIDKSKSQDATGELYLKHLIEEEAISLLKKDIPFFNAPKEDLQNYIKSLQVMSTIVSSLDMAINEYKPLHDKYDVHNNNFEVLRDKTRRYMIDTMNLLGVNTTCDMSDLAEELLNLAIEKTQLIGLENDKSNDN